MTIRQGDQVMEVRQFGKTDMRVTALGFGGGEIGWGTDDDTAATLLNQVLDAGINVIDTAACYGASEERIGSAIGHRRSEYYLFSKCGHAAGIEEEEWTAGLIERSVERSLRRLRTEYLDLLQLHSCSEEILRQGDVIAVLERVRDTGKTRYIGYSGDGNAALYALECGSFDALQTSLSIADQEPIELTLPLARKQELGFIAKRPIANVAWLPKVVSEDEHKPYGDRLCRLDYPFLRDDPIQGMGLALRFTISTSGLHTAIVGTTSSVHLSENIEALRAGPLPADEYDEIRRRWAEVAQEDWAGRT